ncbi:MAG: DUF4416 family protein [Planctomycetota bacterium]
MGKIISPAPVKLFVGVLVSDRPYFKAVVEKLTSLFGAIDLTTADEGIPFTFTDYYAAEMGANIRRFFLSFDKLIKPDSIAEIKIRTNELEEAIAREVKSAPHLSLEPGRSRSSGQERSALPRPINLDPGYLTAGKIILATTKDYAHRIYIKDGIYAEITLQYRSGQEGARGWTALPWTYPDYRTKEYLDFFERMRKIYLSQNR